MKWSSSVFSALLALTLPIGCATPASSSASSGLSPALGEAKVNPKDRVLWQYRHALTALRQGEVNRAKTLLDDALLTIGGLSANDKSAKKSRGYFSEESRKTFRGEPYERVMAYYYRGILYWMDGEPDNARACFRNAQIQDSDTENKEYAGDYVLLDYLDGLATVKLGGDGSDAFKRALNSARLQKPPPYQKGVNALFFIEFGKGPEKYATGEHSEQLRIRPGSSAAYFAQIKVQNANLRTGPYDDLSYQATTRGGRVMDHILANKAVFKSATDTAGNAALLSGLIVAQNRNTEEAGIGLLAFGLVSKIVSAAATPAADTRTWDNLPQYLSFASFELTPGSHLATVEFLTAQGELLPTLTKTISLNVAPSRDTVVFVSDQSRTSKEL